MRAAVVGGGLAGLAAALDLVDAGVDVTLYEARPTLGGAVQTLPEREGDPDLGAKHRVLDVPRRVVVVIIEPDLADGARAGRGRGLRPDHRRAQFFSAGCKRCPNCHRKNFRKTVRDMRRR